MSHFFQRGGAWVLVQSVLMWTVTLLAVIYRGAGHRPAVVFMGAVLMIVGAGVAIAGKVALGKSLTPFPMPLEQAELMQHGIYAVIRHPLYTSVISVSIGWALVWKSWPALLIAVALIPFFYAKAWHEEQWLRQKFPAYADYECRVRRFIPWLF